MNSSGNDDFAGLDVHHESKTGRRPRQHRDQPQSRARQMQRREVESEQRDREQRKAQRTAAERRRRNASKARPQRHGQPQRRRRAAQTKVGDDRQRKQIRYRPPAARPSGRPPCPSSSNVPTSTRPTTMRRTQQRRHRSVTTGAGASAHARVDVEGLRPRGASRLRIADHSTGRERPRCIEAREAL